MSLTAILTIAILCAQVAAAYTTSMKPIALSEMDPFDPDFLASVYAARMSQHVFRGSDFGAPAPWWTGAPTCITTIPAKAPTTSLYSFFVSAAWFLTKYLLCACLLWAVIVAVPWRGVLCWLGEWTTRTITKMGDRIRRGRQNVDNTIDDIRHHLILATTYRYYQEMTNWFGRHKLRLIVFLVGIHLLSTMISSQFHRRSNVSLSWTDLQQYIDNPMPAYLFRQPANLGSSSHYEPEITWWSDDSHVIIDTVPEPVDTDSATTTTTTPLLEESKSASSGAYVNEKRRKLPGKKVAFCRQCRQEHCCEVYH